MGICRVPAKGLSECQGSLQTAYRDLQGPIKGDRLAFRGNLKL